MRKYILLLTFSFLIHDASAQSALPYKDGKVFYEIIQDVSEMSKAQLFAASKKWLSDAFISAKSVIQSEDFETGQITGQGNLKANNRETAKGLFMTQFTLQFSIQIDCRDDRYRIRIYDIVNYTPASRYLGEIREPIEKLIARTTKKNQKQRLDDTLIDADNKVIDLIAGLHKVVVNAKDDDF